MAGLNNADMGAMAPTGVSRNWCLVLNSFQIQLASYVPLTYPLFQAMNGFMMMITQTGKLLFISENAAEYLGHSMVSLGIETSNQYRTQKQFDEASLCLSL